SVVSLSCAAGAARLGARRRAIGAQPAGRDVWSHRQGRSRPVKARFPEMETDPNCVFCKIVRGEIPSRKVYEDADVLAFHDVSPKAPVHFMLIPKRHVATLYDVGESDAPTLGKMIALAGRLAREQGADDGF